VEKLSETCIASSPNHAPNRLHARYHRTHTVLELLVLTKLIQRLKVADLDAFRSYKDTVVGGACEVTRTLDRAVVPASGFIERHAYPGSEARYFGDVADVRDRAAAGIGVGLQAAARVQMDACRTCQ